MASISLEEDHNDDTEAPSSTKFASHMLQTDSLSPSKKQISWDKTPVKQSIIVIDS